MSDFVIYENPGVKAARLERENLQLKRENAQLREQLGHQVGAPVASAVASTAPRVAAQQSFQHGACSVTIGRLPGGRAATAIPALEQQAPQAPQVQIYNAADAAADLNAQVAAALGAPAAAPATAPVAATATARPVRRMVNGQPGGASGMMEFNLAALKPVAVKAPAAAPAVAAASPQQALAPRFAPAPPPTMDSAMDEARQRFALLELDVDEQHEQQQTKAG